MTIRIHRNDVTNDIEEIEFSGDNAAEREQAAIYLQAETLRELQKLRTEVRAMAEDLTALDSAVAQEGTDVAALAANITALAQSQNQAFADLQAKIAANPTGDFTAEIASLATNHATLTQALATVNAAIAASAAADPGPAASSSSSAS